MSCRGCCRLRSSSRRCRRRPFRPSAGTPDLDKTRAGAAASWATRPGWPARTNTISSTYPTRLTRTTRRNVRRSIAAAAAGRDGVSLLPRGGGQDVAAPGQGGERDDSRRVQSGLNGRAIDAARIRRLHAPGGRDARIHSIPLEPYSQYIVTLAPTCSSAARTGSRYRSARASRGCSERSNWWNWSCFLITEIRSAWPNG